MKIITGKNMQKLIDLRKNIFFMSLWICNKTLLAMSYEILQLNGLIF